jgi:thiol:disulfide interchange protein DsbA
MLEFAKENGLDVAKVKSTWEGFGMTTKVAQAQRLSEDYRVDGVPMIGIHGRYTTSPSQGGMKECLATTDTLVAQLRKTVV